MENNTLCNRHSLGVNNHTKMYVTYTRIYGWSDYGGESSYQPGYRLENMMWMTLLVYDYIIPGDIQTFEGDCASSSDSDHGKKIIELDGMYNISTSSEKYHMNFYMYSQNDSDSKAVGLYKIEIALESEVAEDNFIWDNPPNGIFVGGQN